MNKTTTIDELLKAKRQSCDTTRPSDGFWEAVFAPSLTRKLMAALSNPPREGHVRRVIGWATPVVFGSLLAAAIGIAYFFSPERAIGRWEAQAASKQYIVDNLQNEAPKRTFGVDGGSLTLKTGKADTSVMSYQFTAAPRKQEEF